MALHTGIDNAIKALAPGLRDRFGVVSISLFGSAARGQLTDSSDVDVLVAFSPSAKVTLFTLAALARELEAAVGRPVDVVEDHPRLAPALKRSIERDRRRVA